MATPKQTSTTQRGQQRQPQQQREKNQPKRQGGFSQLSQQWDHMR